MYKRQVTSGPGATNLVTGLATAYYDSVPLVCFTGQVSRHLIGNDAFQEVDIVGITRSITKYGVTVRNREDLGRILKEAFYIARTGPFSYTHLATHYYIPDIYRN